MQYVDIVENIMTTTNKFNLILYIHFYKKYLKTSYVLHANMTEHSLKIMFGLLFLRGFHSSLPSFFIYV